MLVVVAYGAGDVRVEERDPPPLRPGDVRIRVAYGGICGSDLSYFRHGAVGDFTIREPLILGHEVSGRVEEDPSGTLAPGTAVTVHPATPCGRCPECLSGHPHVCRAARYLGSAAQLPHTQGGFAELLSVRRDQVHPVPPALSLRRAALAEPLSVALHALSRAGHRVADATVLVNGAGPIGLLLMAAIAAEHPAELWASDVLDRPLRIAEAVGATRVVQVGRQERPEASVDIAFEASGVPVAFGATLASVRRRGTMVQVGLLPGGPQTSVLAPIATRELTVHGSFRFDQELPQALDLLARTPQVDHIITHTFDVGQAVQALTTAADGSVSSKVLLRFDGAE
jgi:L-idonate 5-dehydrogenase